MGTGFQAYNVIPRNVFPDVRLPTKTSMIGIRDTSLKGMRSFGSGIPNLFGKKTEMKFFHVILNKRPPRIDIEIKEPRNQDENVKYKLFDY